MAEKYAGSAVLEVDGVEIEIVDLNETTQTGRKLVKTMNSAGVAKGFAKGIATYELSLTAVIPTDGTEIDWANIEDAKLTVYPLGKDERRTSYLGCFTTQVGEKYSVDNEAMVDIQMSALRKLRE